MAKLSIHSIDTRPLLHDERQLQKQTDCSDCNFDEESQLSESFSTSCDESVVNDRSSRNKGKKFNAAPTKLRRSAQLLFGVSGVYASYICYGVLQEHLFRYRSVDGKAFQSVWFLQILESIASLALGIIGRYFCGGRRDLPLKGIMMSGVSQVFSKVFCSMSLAAGLSFPVMTLAKSAKIVPVMIGQLILGGSRYGVRDYLFAALLVTGTVMLSLGTSNHMQSVDSSNSTLGIVFVLFSLFMDGCTGGLQKQLKRDTADTPPTTYDFLLFTHVSMLSTSVLVSLVCGDFWQGALFLQQEPSIAVLVMQLCALSVIGQSFIFYVIANFDSMVCATVTTTRKMWSVMLSITMFQHQLSSAGYGGLALALAGLAVEVHDKVFGSVRKEYKATSIRRTNTTEEKLDDDLV